MGGGQAVRHGSLEPVCVGSNPTRPASSILGGINNWVGNLRTLLLTGILAVPARGFVPLRRRDVSKAVAPMTIATVYYFIWRNFEELI